MHWLEFSTPQTLKIEGYIKKKKVIVLFDSGSTHNFIHCKLAKDLNCFVYPAPEFQVMIADGGTIDCSGKCNKHKIYPGKPFSKKGEKRNQILCYIIQEKDLSPPRMT